MKNPKILYILISIFCVFAIIAGIYAQFVDSGNNETDIAGQDEIIENEKNSARDKKSI